MLQEQLKISLPDGNHNAVSVFLPENNSSKRPLFIIFPAMGVKGSYYRPLAELLASKNFVAAVADLRGHGASSLRPSRKTDFGYEEMITQDYAVIMDTISARFPDNPTYMLGHSLGGQLACLYLSRYKTKIEGLILICCCSVYYKGWRGVMRYGTWAFTQFYGFVAGLLGYFPGKKLGFGGLEAKTVMKDWSAQARTGLYKLRNSHFDYEQALSVLKVPSLAITLEGDTFAPEAATKNLYQKFDPETSVVHRHISKSLMAMTPLNHFNWARKPELVVSEIEKWVG